MEPRDETVKTPYWLSVRGEIASGATSEIYKRLLELAQELGGLGASQSVSLFFGKAENVPTMSTIEAETSQTEYKIVPAADLSPEELNEKLRTLGHLLRARRNELGSSQSSIAGVAGVSQTYLSQLELASRMSRPDSAALISIANTLGLSAETVLQTAGYEVEPAEQG